MVHFMDGSIGRDIWYVGEHYEVRIDLYCIDRHCWSISLAQCGLIAT